MTPNATEKNSIKIDKELLDKVKFLAQKNGQTITGYIYFKLSKIVEKEWNKFPKQ